MPDLSDGADAVKGTRLSFLELNLIKNAYYGPEPANPVTGLIWRSNVDEILRQWDGAAWQIIPFYSVDVWTPEITFGGAAVGVTYGGTNAGRYVRIGNWVTITGRLVLTSKGASNGDALITNLPFTCKNENGSLVSPSLQLETITFANQWSAYININTKTIVLNELTEGGVLTALTDANFDNASEIIIGGTYEIET